MVIRPTSFRHSSISSKDISCPQAYNVNDDLSLHEANPTSLEGDQNHLSTSTGEDYATNNQDAPYKPGKWLYLAFATLGVPHYHGSIRCDSSVRSLTSQFIP